MVARPRIMGGGDLRRGGHPLYRSGVAERELTGAAADHAWAIRLRRARLEAGWSVASAAAALSVSEGRLRRLEDGRLPVRASFMVRAARTYRQRPAAMLPGVVDVRLAEAVAALDVAAAGFDLPAEHRPKI